MLVTNFDLSFFDFDGPKIVINTKSSTTICQNDRCSYALLSELCLNLRFWNIYQFILRHQEKIDRQQRAVKEIQITFGFNDSDNTVGWKRYENAMTMYYLHPTQKFIQEEHSFPLVPGLEWV